METIYILIVLALTLLEFRNYKKTIKTKDETITGNIKKKKELRLKVEALEEDIDDFVRNNSYWLNEYNNEKNTSRALKGANTKHKATIDELEEKNKDQADTIKRMNSQFDEVHVLLETLLVTPKKKQAELVNEFTFKTK